MRLDETPESQNVEDRRDDDSAGGGGGFGGGGLGGGGGMGVPGGRGGIGGIGLVIVVIAALFFGFDPGALLGGGDQAPPAPAPRTGFNEERPRPPQPGQQQGQNDEMRRFVARVLGSTEEVWQQLFRERLNREYRNPTLVLFSGHVRSACGQADAAVGPFYCPGDFKVYIEISFYEELRSRFRAPGDFAQAYVIAHEIGHHVQRLLGILDKVDERKRQGSQIQANALQVRVELQADCFAGVWAYHANQKRRILEPGDVEEALTAAAAIGDDRLQKQGRGYVQPETFTHGSSAQRMRWFRRGIDSGDLRQCDTFSAQQL